MRSHPRPVHGTVHFCSASISSDALPPPPMFALLRNLPSLSKSYFLTSSKSPMSLRVMGSRVQRLSSRSATNDLVLRLLVPADILGLLKHAKASWGSLTQALGDEDRLEWYCLSPQERFVESQRLWANFLALGGTCDPEPDSQSPFYVPPSEGPGASHGRASVHPVRRRRVHSGHRPRRRR